MESYLRVEPITHKALPFPTDRRVQAERWMKSC